MFKLVLPAIITIVGNVIFYLFIKGRIDSSIEKNKISFNEVFKEKLNIYRQLLKKTYSLKRKLYQFQYFGTIESDAEKIMLEINSYIEYYTVNQPFLSDEMLEDLNQIRSEFQDIFEKFYKQKSIGGEESLKEFFEASKKLKSNNPFKEIENRLLLEVKKDLRVNSF